MPTTSRPNHINTAEAVPESSGLASRRPPPDIREYGLWRSGKLPGCHFGYAGPFTEAYQLGNIALRTGHRIEWDPLAFRVTNCQEANQYLRREYRKGFDPKEIAGAAFAVGKG